jgi:hypothetical protein
MKSGVIILLICCSCSILNGQTNVEIARVLWRNQHTNVTCEVYEQRRNLDELPIRELLFVDSRGKHTTAIQTADSLLSIFPLGEGNAPLVTVWLGGSAYHIRVFIWKNGKPNCVLDDGSKSFPEIVFDVTHTGDIFFFLNDAPGGPDDPANWTTKCYRWDDNKMVFVKKVPASARFRVLP